jgi:putative nucleotidyltransferase with HDIG domain
MLVAGLAAHDRKTRGHSERVRAFTDVIAEEMAVSGDDRDRLRWASLLHDIGKLEVPSATLNKAGKPDDEEWAQLKRHPLEGARIAAPLLPWLGEWGRVIAEHHERYDGAGYPNRLAGDAICLGARIVSVADSFEVMTAARSYKRPMTPSAARVELARCAGTQFDPGVVRALFAISLGRLWWMVGPAAWIAQVPFMLGIGRAGTETVVAVRTAGELATRAVVAFLAVALSGVAAGARPAIADATYGREGAGSARLTTAGLASEGDASASVTSASTDATTAGTGSNRSGGGGPGAGAESDGSTSGGSTSGGATSGGSTSDGSGSGPLADAASTAGAAVGNTVDTATGSVDQTVDTATGSVDQTVDTASGAVDTATGAVDQTVDSATGAASGTVSGLGLGGSSPSPSS